MKIKNKHAQAGFTLLELILYVGIVALTMISVYKFYHKKEIDTKVYVLNKNLQVIDNSIQGTFPVIGGTYSPITNFSSLTSAFAIGANMIPQSMVIDANNIGNDFGGTLTFSAVTVSGTAGYAITLTNIPTDACAKLATSSYGANVQEIAINGTTLKTANAALTNAQLITITAACSSTTNTIAFRNVLLTMPTTPVGSTTPVRAKEQPYYIPTVGSTATSVGFACAGGSVWNGSFCSCPAGTQWNGSSCIAFGASTQPGWCPRGQGYAPGTKTCAVLPATTASYKHWNLAATPPSAVGNTSPGNVLSAVGSSGNVYLGGRNYSSTITTAPQQTVAAQPAAPAAGQTTYWSASNPYTQPAVGGQNFTWAAGHLDGVTVPTCVNSTWNATYLRCVTPVTPITP